MQMYSYASFISLKCSCASNFDILFVVGSYMSEWYFLASHRFCTLIYLSLAAEDTSRLRIPRESLLVYPIFYGS